MEKVFRDPVHDYITVNHPVISELIDTAEFQRLRRIKQLGTSSFTFHGADKKTWRIDSAAVFLIVWVFTTLPKGLLIILVGISLWNGILMRIF